MSVAELTALPQPYPLFNLTNEYIWAQCPLNGYRDVWAEVRLDLTNGERRSLSAQHDELVKHREVIEGRIAIKADELEAKRTAALDSGDSQALADVTEALAQFSRERAEARLMNQAALYELVAPFVRNWNIPTPGTTEVAPAPQAAGIAAFDAINDVIGNWLFYALITAYSGNGFRRPVEKTATSSTESAEPDEPTKKSDETTPDEKQPDSPSDPIPASPRNSRGRSPSA